MKRLYILCAVALLLLGVTSSAGVIEIPSAEASGMSLVVASGSSGTPDASTLTQVGSATNANGEDVYSLETGSRTLGSDSDSCLVCIIGAYSYNSQTVSSVSWGDGEAYEKAFTRLGRTGTDWVTEIWYLTDWPSTLTSTIKADFADEFDAVISCTEWTGVDQTTPMESFDGNTGVDTNPVSETISSESGAKVVDVFASQTCTATVGADQVEQANVSVGSVTVGSSIENGAASVTMSWNMGETRWRGISAASINPK